MSNEIKEKILIQLDIATSALELSNIHLISGDIETSTKRNADAYDCLFKIRSLLDIKED